MNGDRTAAQYAADYAESAAKSAQRSSESAKAAATSALECYQSQQRTEREVHEVRRDIRKLTEVVGSLTVATHQPAPQPAAPPQQIATHSILESEDWEDSPTGTHRQVNKRTFERWTREQAMSADAKKWRALWRRVRWLVFALVGGATTFGGEQLVKYLIGHH